MPDVLELIARGIHRADELKGAPPWEQQSFFVREAQMDRARSMIRALRAAGVSTLELDPPFPAGEFHVCGYLRYSGRVVDADETGD